MLDFTRLDKVRRQRPLIHCVSNIVTANDCANLALAVGASPMMAQAPEEMEAISAVSDATVLNTGTPDAEKFRACRICAVSARHPVVLDPVGVGASPWRLGQVRALLDLFTPSILRVNLGEARALLGSDGQEQGVDSPLPASREARRDTAMDLARRRGTAVLLSGPEDLITDGARVWCVTGGSGRMSLVTGTGCMLSVLCGVFAAVEPDAAAAAALASAFWKICARRAEHLAADRGSGSFRTALLDAVGGAIHHIGNIHKYARREDVPEKTMFIITTDGYENASRCYDYEHVRRMIERQKERYGWEFLFLGANIDAAKEAARFGIGADRSVNYKCDEAGTALNYEVISEAVCSVRAARPLSADWKRRIDEDVQKRGR